MINAENHRLRRITVVDTPPTPIYTESDAGRIPADSPYWALAEPSRHHLHLDSGIPWTHEARLQRGRGAIMKHRQKLTINDEAKWICYNSAQDLVNMVAEAIATHEKPCNVTFGAYAENWYTTFHRPKISSHTAEGLESKLRCHILPFIGDKPINSIRAEDVQQIVNSCSSASSAKWAKSIVNMILDAAIQDELYTHPNPARDKRIAMPTGKTKRKPLANDSVSLVMDILPRLSSETAPMFALMFMTGCRRGEALGARWEDIDWTNKTIHLQRVVRFSNNQPDVSDKMKTASANRTVSLWDDFIPYWGQRKAEGFIIHCDGQPLSERQYRTRWRHLQAELKAGGLTESFTAHQLRHTYATIAANSGRIPPKVLQGMLGHANFQTTMNIYADLDADRVRENSAQMGAEYAKFAAKSCSEIAMPESDT